MIKKCIHAESMTLYAQDAMETEKPWERWEVLRNGDDSGYWNRLRTHPEWHSLSAYRRIAKPININGFEVPEPCRNPLNIGEKYYIPNLRLGINGRYISGYGWDNSSVDIRHMNNGLIHLSEKSAEIHAKALLTFSEAKNGS